MLAQITAIVPSSPRKRGPSPGGRRTLRRWRRRRMFARVDAIPPRYGWIPACTGMTGYFAPTIFTPVSFSCASISEGTYLSPKPSALAATRLWCTASPITEGSIIDSVKWV